MPDQLLSIEEAAQELDLGPGLVQHLIDEGWLQARADGLISKRELRAFRQRALKLAARFFRLRANGLSAEEAYQVVYTHKRKE
jgi:hypothetical protein